jgi:peptidoglycan/LPS O-acetylase OafA/YrhL
MAVSESRIPSLDGLRALSIGVVMASHTARIYDPKDPQFSPIWAILSNGQVGVEIFFVISGFLITTLLARELDQSGTISLRDFYVRRAFRILPPYYAFLLVILAAMRLQWVSIGNKEWLSSFLFFWNYVPSSNSWWLGHTWSLGVEEQFYILWPLALAGLGRRGARTLALWIFALSPLFRIGSYFALPAFRDKLTFFLSSRADALMAGCILALCASEPWFIGLWNKGGRLGSALAGTAFIFVVSPALFSLFHFTYQMSVGYTLEVICICFILLWTVENPGRGICRALNWKPVVYLGVLSYSMYLWQQPFVRYRGTWLTTAPYNFLIIGVLAVTSYFLIERPALKARRRFQQKEFKKQELHFATPGDSLR